MPNLPRLPALAPSLRAAAGGPRRTAFALAAIIVLSLLAKLALIWKGGVQARDILDMEYGFGPVIRALYERGSLEACGVAVGLDFCGVAARMPVLPWLYATAGKLIGTGQIHLAVLKVVLCSALLAAALLRLNRVLGDRPLPRAALVGLAALLFLGPQYLKHAITVQYEESLLIELLPVYFLALASVYARQADGDPLAAGDRVILALLVLFASGLYFLKSSLVLFALVGIAAPVVLIRTPPWVKLAACVPFALGLVAWGGVNYAYHGQVRLGSSYNGENFYRGQNGYSFRIYPEIHLDRLIDSPEARLNDGERVPLPDWTHHFPPFKTEWEWHDHFKRLGQEWIKEHPAEALAFTLRKAYVLFLEPRKVPFRQSALPETEPPEYSAGTLVAGLVWIVLLRVLFFAGLVTAGRELWSRRAWSGPSAFFLLFVGAYAAPYVIGFAYQRHITPLLVFAAVYWMLLMTERRRPAGA